MRILTATLTCLIANFSFAQVQFFQSDELPEPYRKVSYASVTLRDGLLLYNAPDFTIYAYENNNLKWKKTTGWSSDIPPFILSTGIWVSGHDSTMILDPQNGNTLRVLPFTRLDTEPFEKNGIYYGTGLLDGGRIYAYDYRADSVKWSKFIAHGTMRRPYFLPDHVYSNAESIYWIKLDYNGALTDKKCDKEEYRFPSELSCAENFNMLTHDGMRISGKLAEDIFSSSEPQYLLTKNRTLILEGSQLWIIGNKLKKEKTVDLERIADTLYFQHSSRNALVKADEERTWIMFNEHLLVYNHRKNMLERTIDLRKWSPHQVLLENDKIWVISRTDGRLYGLKY